MMKVLITGGAGYIGSHTTLEFLQAGFNVSVIDNLINSKKESIIRIEEISNRKVTFFPDDLLDKPALEEIFRNNRFDAVIHFAGLKAVGESVEKPLLYYHNNITGTLNLLDCMQKYNVKKIVFSSSATVYGNPHKVPIKEDFPVQPTNPYGRTKLMIEDILKDVNISDPQWDIALLRYFNPIGAHISGKIGEDPNGIPNNLLPYIAQVAVGKLPRLNVFGNDYDTPDGTGVRDYIHVVDLAQGHLKALQRLNSHPGVVTYNLGTGKGYSVLEIIEAFQEASGKEIPYKIVDRRAGDVASIYADASLANTELNWSADKDILSMCRDTWNWQSQNPEGF
ncbi:MAG: UDP-glucose 4-epimerase GalE, partial [Candidatus Stygibacter australis]|nr:UDP-glucose 4-epimerase GalE [Candidatus Stygibacter australis]